MPPGRKAGESHVPFIGVSFTGLETLTKLHNRLGSDIRLIPVDRAKHLASDLGFDIRGEAEAAPDWDFDLSLAVLRAPL